MSQSQTSLCYVGNRACCSHIAFMIGGRALPDAALRPGDAVQLQPTRSCSSSAHPGQPTPATVPAQPCSSSIAQTRGAPQVLGAADGGSAGSSSACWPPLHSSSAGSSVCWPPLHSHHAHAPTISNQAAPQAHSSPPPSYSSALSSSSAAQSSRGPTRHSVSPHTSSPVTSNVPAHPTQHSLQVPAAAAAAAPVDMHESPSPTGEHDVLACTEQPISIEGEVLDVEMFVLRVRVPVLQLQDPHLLVWRLDKLGNTLTTHACLRALEGVAAAVVAGSPSSCPSAASTAAAAGAPSSSTAAAAAAVGAPSSSTATAKGKLGAVLMQLVHSWAGRGLAPGPHQHEQQQQQQHNFPGCNPRQSLAIRAAMHSPLTLIHGPPGTGKVGYQAASFMCCLDLV